MYSASAAATASAAIVATHVAPDPLFVKALVTIPTEDWCRTWPADQTFMLRITSKRVKEAVVKMRLPVVVCLNMNLFDNTRNGIIIQKKKLLTQMTSFYSIIKLVLPGFYYGTCDHILALLGQCPKLEHLDIKNNHIYVEGSNKIAKAIGQLTHLRHLNLEKNYIESKGMEYLAGEIRKCTALQHLNIGYNNFGVIGANHLAGALLNCSALTALNLSGNSIKNEGLDSLVRASQFRALTSVDLSDNQIEGATSLRSLLEHCPSLTSLNVNQNSIGTRGTICLTAVLSKQAMQAMQPNVLKELDISCNQIGLDGAKRFVNSMRYLKLTRIDLSHNLINHNEIERITEALDKYPTLTYLV